MKRLLLAILCLLAACAPASTPSAAPPTPILAAPTATTLPTRLPEPTQPPTAKAADPGIPVTFPASGDVVLSGVLYGADTRPGARAVIFSNMGDQHPASWAAMAQAAAAAGYMALTYDFRYWVNGKMDASLMPFVGDDLSAAAEFVRQRGASQVALVGASMGGVATAKAAAAIGADAVVIIAAPMQVPGVDLAVSEAELQGIAAPKLFITSENDDTVAPEALKAMYALALEPKELYVYPDTKAHGTLLFKTSHGADLQSRILAFITSNLKP